MRIEGTVVADASTVHQAGAVVTKGETIAFVGDVTEARDRYPDHPTHSVDLVVPGMVGAHVHSVQSLGRGIADDLPLLPWLEEYVLPLEASMDAEAMATAATLGYCECLASGVTTVQDHLSVHHADAAIEAALDVGIRARVGKAMMDRDAPAGLQQATDVALAESERLIEQYHGAANDRIRYAVTPRFALTSTEDLLCGSRELADAYEGVRIHTHAAEQRDEVDAVRERTGERNITFLDDVGLTGPDVTLAHCVWTDDAERATLATTDTCVAHCPTANMKLGSGVAPVPEYREHGITVGIGADGPPCNNTLDPFAECHHAALLSSVETGDPGSLTAREVFHMATWGGARAAGFERVGALREGWRADVVGLSTEAARATPVRDPIAHLVYAAHGDDVCLTVVDGSVVYDDGAFTTVDGDAVRERASELAATLPPES